MTLHVGVRPGRGLVIVGALALVAGLTTPVGAYPRPGATERVSVASDGTEGDNPSTFPSVSADGRYVAFVSRATNLVPGKTNLCADPIYPVKFPCEDVFVHDRQAGTTERVSVASDGTEANGPSGRLGDPGPVGVAISADGRHVAFSSRATNLVPGDTNGEWDVFVRDRQAGTTERVSVGSDGTEGNGDSSSPLPAISADGRYVPFVSRATNLVPGDTNNTQDVFVRDRQAGTTERVSVASDGAEGNGLSYGFAISADGRYVAFDSIATNLVSGDTNNARDVFVRDLQAGTTQRVSVASDGTEANNFSSDPAISADGRHIVFVSPATNLVPGDTNNAQDVFVHDRQTGTTERVSVASDGSEANNASNRPAISADGRHIVFVRGGGVFVHDRQTGATGRVSVASDGAEEQGGFPAISADGRHVAFHSGVSTLVPDDTNDATDIFVRDRGPAVGVGALEVGEAPGELVVSGWAGFAGVTAASAEDPGDDGEDALGAEIVGASLIHRPEQEDLLLRLALTSLPHVNLNECRAIVTGGTVCAQTGAGAAGVLYRWSFTAGGTAYEVRALRAAATADPPATDAYFALYRCAPSCAEAARLSGGIGTTGAEVRASVPLEALGAEAGTELTGIEASAVLGEATPGSLVVLDEVALPEAPIPVPRVDLGIAPASTPEGEVAYTTAADLADGRFSGTVDVSSLALGEYRVWARACLGDVCGARSAEVTL